MNTIETYVDFIENQLPDLQSGDYTLEVSQTLSATGIEKNNTFPSKLKFSVSGNRFVLKPTDIISVFPPPNSLGEHSNVFPQVVVARNTLPWERRIAEPKDTADKENVKKMPWMALLVFNEGELGSPDVNAAQTVIEQGTILTLADVRKMVGAQEESGENPQEKISVIYAQKSVLKSLLAPASVLAKLSHARESSLRLNLDNPASGNMYCEMWDSKNRLAHAAHLPADATEKKKQIKLDAGNLKPGIYTVKVTIGGKNITVKPEKITVTPNDEFGHKVAVVVANRLPKPGVRSIVHLVSLEGRYQWDGSNYSFNFGKTDEKDDSKVLIPLVTLKSWSFTCVKEEHNFDNLLKTLAVSGRGDSFNTLRLPLRPDPKSIANRFLESGYVPMPHFFRRGGKSVSWYRSPLIPGNKPGSLLQAGQLPASCADALLLYDEQYGMFDVSYAAAWELGRLMALNNKSVSVRLYHWKRRHSAQKLLAEQQELYPHLPFHKNADQTTALPGKVDRWFSALGLLEGLPFNYLVPDERMLPKESFRFFQLDPDWISCLIDGAFSVGKVTSGDAATDRKLHQTFIAGQQPPVVSGFLLRSYVVKGWPDLQVDAYSRIAGSVEEMDGAKLKMLRLAHLSPTVLLCLFEGDAKAVDLHQKPEMLHWGFDIPDSKTPDVYTKKLRNASGKVSAASVTLDDQLWNKTTRIVNISQLYSSVQGTAGLDFGGTFTVAQFALSMIEGVQKVRFARPQNLRMESGKRLNKGEKMDVPGYEGSFLTLQNDGNFALYHPADRRRWSTLTHGKPATHVVMQPDGNLVIYNGTAPIWASDTHNIGANGGYFEIDMVSFQAYIKKPDGSVARNISLPQTLRMESGQRLNAGEKIDVPGYTGSFLILQNDGNFVFYHPANQPKWATMTHGRQVTHAVMQPDGNLVIYNGTTLIWASDTHNIGANGGYFEIDLVTLQAYIKKPDGSPARHIPTR